MNCRGLCVYRSRADEGLGILLLNDDMLWTPHSYVVFPVIIIYARQFLAWDNARLQSVILSCDCQCCSCCFSLYILGQWLPLPSQPLISSVYSGPVCQLYKQCVSMRVCVALMSVKGLSSSFKGVDTGKLQRWGTTAVVCSTLRNHRRQLQRHMTLDLCQKKALRL